jgi:anti-anti-sigma regulatory factor
MASNFVIRISESNGGFSLKLGGDFDTTSAYELIYAIKKLPKDTVKICVNTNGLKKIHSFGLDVFNGLMNSLNGQSARIVFTGHNATRLSFGNPWPTPKVSKFFIKELSNPYV